MSLPRKCIARLLIALKELVLRKGMMLSEVCGVVRQWGLQDDGKFCFFENLT